MTKHGDEAGPDRPLTREERLAAQLRANLRRRKAQARGMNDANAPANPAETADSASSRDDL